MDPTTQLDTVVQIVTNLFTIVGVIVAVLVLWYTGRQFKHASIQLGLAAQQLRHSMEQAERSAMVNRSQFWLEIEKMFASHNAVNLRLRPGGEWAPRDGDDEGFSAGYPQSPEEWEELENFMGLFEHCESMLEMGLIDLDLFRDLFGYRLDNLLANPHIVGNLLHGHEREDWTRFISLCNRYEKTSLVVSDA